MTTQSNVGRFEPGETVDEFRLETRLGHGGGGQVFLSRDGSRRVAIKLLGGKQTGGSFSNDDCIRFAQEARLLAQCQHPNLVRIEQYRVSGEVPYIVMEYVEGKSLAEVSPLPLAEAIHTMMDILDGVGVLHDHDVWHRDLKPENLMLTRSGQIKIIDLGAGRDDGTGVTSRQAAPRTELYAPPEILDRGREQDVSSHSDIYSLGVTLFYLLTKDFPWEGSTPAEQRRMPALANYLPPDPELEKLDAILAQATAFAPADRFQSVDEFRDALATIVPSRTADDATRKAVVRFTGKSTRRKQWLFGTVVGIVVLSLSGWALVARWWDAPSPSTTSRPVSEMRLVAGSGWKPCPVGEVNDPKLAADGNPQTAWCVGTGGAPMTLTFSLPEKTTVSGLRLTNGYALGGADSTTAREYGFVQTAILSGAVTGVDEGNAPMPVPRMAGLLPLREPVETDMVSLRVIKSAPGTKYDCVCLSEVELSLSKQPRPLPAGSPP